MDALHTDQFPLKDIKKLTLVTPTHWETEKIPTQKCVGKDETHSYYKPHLRTAPYNLSETTNSQPLPN